MQQSKCLTDRQTNWFDRIRKWMTLKNKIKNEKDAAQENENIVWIWMFN